MENEELLARLRLYARHCLLALFCVFGFSAEAQDPVFSQYYIHQNYSNPAYAGYTNDLTISASSRLQYTHVPGVFATNSIYANLGCSDKAQPLGYGLMLYDNIEGEGFMHTFEGAFQLSSKIYFKFGGRSGKKGGGISGGNKKYFNNYQKGSRVRRGAYIYGGLQVGLGQKFLDWSKLTFSDQYTPYLEGVQNATYINPQVNSSNVYMDIGAGVRSMAELGRKNKPSFISLGAAIYHINKPIHTFYNTQIAVQPRYSFFLHYYLGDKLKARKKEYLYWTLSTSSDLQQGMRTHATFVYRDLINKTYRSYINSDKKISIDNFYASVGLGFRRQYFTEIDKNLDAIIFCTTFTVGNISVGYSYDYTTSTLQWKETFGTHEIAIKIRFSGLNTCKKRECPPLFEFGHDVPRLSM